MTYKRVWTGDDGTYVPDLGLEVNNGDEVEFDTEPNNDLFVVPSAAKKTTRKSEED